MEYINLGRTDLKVSQISLGCMRIAALSKKEAEELIKTALDQGINFFDHADIYGGGQCENLFSQAVDMNSNIREKMIIQTKCGIRNGFYDFSKEYIISSVESSLKRLKTDYIDVLLLHRPDALVEPQEVAEAFDRLQSSGKVRHFGVSNHNPLQIQLLEKHFSQKLQANQLQLSVTNTTMLQSGLNVNMENAAAVNRDGSVLDFCRLNDITVQAWSPFQYGFFEGAFLDNEKFPELNGCINKTAEQKGITNTAVAIAWIMRHPAKIQPIIGTTKKQRLIDVCKANSQTLTREEWYEIYRAAGNRLP